MRRCADVGEEAGHRRGRRVPGGRVSRGRRAAAALHPEQHEAVDAQGRREGSGRHGRHERDAEQGLSVAHAQEALKLKGITRPRH